MELTGFIVTLMALTVPSLMILTDVLPCRLTQRDVTTRRRW
jgi:hypothetical protein